MHESEQDRDGVRPLLSVVVPAHDEARNLPSLVEEIVDSLGRLFGHETVDDCNPLFEIVIIDDGSTDETLEVLVDLEGDYPEVRAYSLDRNAGQSAALAAGFRLARGVWVATLDADLQNDPADLVELWDRRRGFDAVLGWRKVRRDLWTKRFVSILANKLRNAVLGQSIRDTGCSTRIIRREFALRLPRFCGMHRFMGPLLLNEGARVLQVPVSHRPRLHGLSHYGVWNRSWRVVVDLLGVAWLSRRRLSFSVEPVEAWLETPSRGVRTRQVGKLGVEP